MKTCYRCQEPIHNADFYESSRGFRHPYTCTPVPVVEAAAPPPPAPESRVRTVIKIVKSEPEIILSLDRRKTAVVACVAAVLGGAAGAAITSFL